MNENDDETKNASEILTVRKATWRQKRPLAVATISQLVVANIFLHASKTVKIGQLFPQLRFLAIFSASSISVLV